MVSDVTSNHMSEISNLSQKKFKKKQDWVEQVIHWKLCIKLKFPYTNKRYMIQYLS